MACSDKSQTSKAWAVAKPFLNGGLSGILATCVIQPVDIVKVRIQLGQGSALHVAKTMLKEDGFEAYYKGLSAGLLWQATYTTARLGSFRILMNKAMQANGGKPLPLYQKAFCGLTAGAIRACFGKPADLALIKMQTAKHAAATTKEKMGNVTAKAEEKMDKANASIEEKLDKVMAHDKPGHEAAHKQKEAKQAEAKELKHEKKADNTQETAQIRSDVTTNLAGHSGYVNNVTVSPNGSLCASGGQDVVAILWDLAEGKRLYSLDSVARILAKVPEDEFKEYFEKYDAIFYIYIPKESGSKTKECRTLKPQFTPSLECWSVSTPACLSHELSVESAKFATRFVVIYDVVPCFFFHQWKG
ncbi:hypothetical protein L7F22_052276 [Adiantum nelumboides]|nr:hypothetical protein [Adiantum nelumboides]